MTETLKIGFVGASGMMGHGMAKNLVTKGFPLSYTVHRRDVDDLREAGATRAESLAALGRENDVVFICVTSAEDVAAVVTGPDGLLTDPREGLVIVDSSTSEPSVTLKLAEACSARGVRFVDAPLSRTPKEAEAGTLNVMVGGDADSLAYIRPALEAFAENIIPIGEVGSAHAIKLLNNFVFQAQVAALSEAFAVAAKAGVDPKKLTDVMSKGLANSPLLGLMAKTLEGEYDTMAFELDNARKDVRYYTRLAGDNGHPAPVGDGVHETLTLASALGFGSEMVLSVVKAQEKLAGTPIRAGSAGEPAAN